MSVTLALLGAGRIGQIHAANLTGMAGAALVAVHDPDEECAERTAAPSGARLASLDEIMADPAIDGVLICTPTDIHADQCEAAARAGKAIFCEKPIDLDLERARSCVAIAATHGVPFMVGFNRRFDPDFKVLKMRLDAGDIGRPELITITSRDPAPPPAGYIRRSGGLFRDMMIHDFDMARFLLGEELSLVSATGSCLIDPAIGAAGDVDTAVVSLRSASGALIAITNSRRASYGYDQRIEVHASEGMLSVANHRTDRVTRAGGEGYRAAPLQDFFIDRYRDAYRAEIAAFVAHLSDRDVPVPTGQDALSALDLADRATAMVR